MGELVETPAHKECKCAQPGWCPHVGIVMDEYMQSVCSMTRTCTISGSPLTKEFRDGWFRSLYSQHLAAKELKTVWQTRYPVPHDKLLPKPFNVTGPTDQFTWPWYVRAITILQKEEDRGIGDTIHRNLARFGANHMIWLLKKLNIDCGCHDRQDYLNAMFPYEKYYLEVLLPILQGESS